VSMKRAVLCVTNPQDYISQFDDYSLMIINPDSSESRNHYLLERSDYSLLVTDAGWRVRDGGDYPNERLFWYTSGTIGDSKFYSFSQEQLDMLVDSICQDYALTANDRYVGIMGLWHAHGQALYWATRHIGCEAHFLSVKEIRKIAKFQPTFLSAIPDMLRVVSGLPLNSLRFIRSGSAPLKDDLYLALKEKFQIPVVEYFGMTETLGHAFTNPLYGEQRMGTVGLPAHGVEALIQNEHLWLKSNRAHTANWFDTGDLAEQDSSGYYRILGRSVDQINVRGYKINPISIESQLKEKFDNIGEFAIFGNTKVNCVYTGDVDPSDIKNALINIHPACNPDLIERVDSLPKTDSGKLSRTWLTKKYQTE
jgi:acyl-CoA synthetase (AMP-forming)/AMP-acid ligase II